MDVKSNDSIRETLLRQFGFYKFKMGSFTEGLIIFGYAGANNPAQFSALVYSK